MAMILIENTSEAAITLHLQTGEGVMKCVIPAARENQFDRKTIDNGCAEIDDSFLKEAMKKPVVKAYFADRGPLRKARKKALDTKAPAPAPTPETAADADDTKTAWAPGSQVPAAAK